MDLAEAVERIREAIRSKRFLIVVGRMEVSYELSLIHISEPTRPY